MLANVAAATSSACLAYLAFRGAEPWRRALAGIAGAPVLVILLLTALGVVGRLAPLWATGAAVAVAVLSATAAIATRWRGKSPSQQAGAQPLVAGVGLAVLILMCCAYVFRAVALPSRFSPDDLSYHAVQPAHWLQDGQFTLGSGNYQAYYPYNSELLSLWFVLPFGTDGLASVAALCWVGVAVAGTVAFGRGLGLPLGASAVPAVLLLAAAPVMRRLNTFSATDLAGPALVLAAIPFLVPCSGAPRRCAIASYAYCGLLGGAAAGVKASLLPAVCVIVLGGLIASARTSGWRRALAPTAVLIAAAVLAGGYWYIRNTVLTGNPLFPAKVGPFDGPFGPAEQARGKLITWLTRPPESFSWSVLSGYVLDWPLPLFVASLGGYAAAAWCLARRSQPCPGDAAAVLVAAGLVSAALYPFMPFSATTEWFDAPLQSQSRYVILPYAGGVLLLGLVLRRTERRAGEYGWLLLVVGVCSFAYTAVSSGGALGAVGVGAVVVLALPVALAMRAIGQARPLAWGLVVCGVGLLLGLAVGQPRIQARADRSLVKSVDGADSGESPQSMSGVLAFLETLPNDTQVAWFGRCPGFYYHFFGRRLQLSPVLVDADGSPRPPLHERWRNEKAVGWPVLAGSILRDGADLSSLLENLRDAGVEYVITTGWYSRPWPPQHTVLSKSAEEVYNDGYSAVFAVQRSGVAAVQRVVEGY